MESKATPDLSFSSGACFPCKDISVLRVCFENVPMSSLEEKLKPRVVIGQHRYIDKTDPNRIFHLLRH